MMPIVCCRLIGFQLLQYQYGMYYVGEAVNGLVTHGISSIDDINC